MKEKRSKKMIIISNLLKKKRKVKEERKVNICIYKMTQTLGSKIGIR